MKHFFVDAETNGLYGEFLSVAALVTDESGIEIDRFYIGVTIQDETGLEQWVKENVLPSIKNVDEYCDTENELLERFWQFWCKYRNDSICIAYVQYPVESRLFARCVEADIKERMLLAPFPIYDLSTLLIANGYAFDTDITKISGLDLIKHDAMNDVLMIAETWKKLTD